MIKFYDHRLRPTALRPGEPVEPCELLALARGVIEPSRTLIRARDREMKPGAVRCHLQAGLQFADGSLGIAGIEQRLAQRLARRERVRGRRNRLLRDRQRRCRISLLEVLERHLHQRPGMIGLEIELALELLDRLLTLFLEQEDPVGVVHVRRLRVARDEQDGTEPSRLTKGDALFFSVIVDVTAFGTCMGRSHTARCLRRGRRPAALVANATRALTLVETVPVGSRRSARQLAGGGTRRRRPPLPIGGHGRCLAFGFHRAR